MSLTEQDVLDAVRAAATSSDTGEIFRNTVALKLGVRNADQDYSRFLVRLESAGLIETVTEVDQEAAPLSFRLVP